MEESLLAIFRRIVAGERHGPVGLPKRLIRILQPVVVRYLRRYRAALGGRDPQAEVEDVLQDILLALFKDDLAKLATWDEERGTPETFLRQVAASFTLSYVRRRREELTLSCAPLEPEGDDGESRILNADELRYLLERIDDELTESERMVFDLRYLEGLTSREVADALGTTPAAIDSMRYRIGKKVEALLVELRGKDPDGPPGPGRPSGVSGIPPRPKPDPSAPTSARRNAQRIGPQEPEQGLQSSGLEKKK